MKKISFNNNINNNYLDNLYYSDKNINLNKKNSCFNFNFFDLFKLCIFKNNTKFKYHKKYNKKYIKKNNKKYKTPFI